MQTLTIDIKTRVPYKRVNSHAYIKLNVVCKGSTETDTIRFVYDTGAYLTVINREVYEWFNLDKLPRTEITIGSYNGTTSGYLFQIPGLKVGEKLLTGIWAFSPNSYEIKQNLLGDNVIEYFRPFQDNLNDCIYFIENPKPEPYISSDGAFSLACDGVYMLDNMQGNEQFTQ